MPQPTRWVSILGVLSFLATGCGESPTSTIAPEKASRDDKVCSNTPQSVTIDGLDGRIIAGDGAKQIMARVMDSTGCLMTGQAVVAWSSSNVNVATVGATGVRNTTFTPLAQGSVTITASISISNTSVMGTKTVTVSPPRVLESIAITPSSARILYTQGVYFQATGTDNYQEPMAVSVTWSSDNPSIVSINQSGFATGVNVGSTTIRAQAGGKSASASAWVAPDIAMSGPTYASDESVTVTGSAVPTGSYHYTWYMESCTNSPGGCNYGGFDTPIASGMNLTNVSVDVSRHDYWVDVKVEVRATAGGPVLSESIYTIAGDGAPTIGGGCSPDVILC